MKKSNSRVFFILILLMMAVLMGCARQTPSEESNEPLHGDSFEDLAQEPEWIVDDIINREIIFPETTPTPLLIASPTVTPSIKPIKQPTITELPKPTADPEVVEGEHGILMGSYTTYFDGSSEGRINNIKNAVNIIDGTVLENNESFSCFYTLSPFTEENGYRKAGSYLNGKVVESIGGGACQVSSTLYNATLGAELSIIERSEHSMTVSYVDVARDAAIAEGSKDFCFVNNSGFRIYIEGSTTDTSLTFRIWGADTKKKNGRKIKIETEIVETIEAGEDIITFDESKPEDYTEVTQYAHTGYVAKLYKVVFKDGVEVDRILINTSSYEAEPMHVTKGGKGE